MADPDGDLKLAAGAVLTPADVPEGWTPTGTPSSSADRSGSSDYVWGQPVLDCIGVKRATLGRYGPAAMSPSFRAPDGPSVSSKVEFEPSTVRAAAEMDLMRNDKLSGCALPPLQQAAKSNGISVDSMQPVTFPRIGDDTVDLQTVSHSNASGADVTAYSDVISVRSGRALVTLTFTGVNAPFPVEQAQQMIQAVVSRLQPQP
ncbi:hypothetical protein EBN03_29400 [Nocardia stercoris]|uniref:Sensor domain-containing protein n=1 Tax=Nocardia stercoris TaxID=2483361 RepID=A0A3M2KV33_9NOCA|nr:hypothetical protein EBN03_29400 [Nocardia stercoris]